MTSGKPDYISPSRFQTQLSTVARGIHRHGWRVPIHRERIREPEQHENPGYIIAKWDFDELSQQATLPEPATVRPRLARGYAASLLLPRVEAGECIQVTTQNWDIVFVPKDCLEAAVQQ